VRKAKDEADFDILYACKFPSESAVDQHGYPQSIVNLLRPGEQFPQEVSTKADMGTRWQKKLNALVKDPDASITRPPVIVPSDYVRTNAETAPHFGIPLPAEYSVRHPVD
jgi:hypothetical protein